MDKIAVLIPCYNEGQTIEKVVTDFRKALPQAHIYVYDNNSTDHTPEIAAAAGADVRFCCQQGKGNHSVCFLFHVIPRFCIFPDARKS